MIFTFSSQKSSDNWFYNIICKLCMFSNHIFIPSGQPRYSLLLKQIFVYNLEGRSNPSGEVKYTTYPDKPGSPKTPYIKGKIYANRVKIGWGNFFYLKCTFSVLILTVEKKSSSNCPQLYKIFS